MEGPVIDTVCQNWHIAHRDFSHLLALFPTPLPFLSSPSIGPKSPWENNRLIVFLSEGGGQSDSSPCLTVELPMVLDSSSSTNSFSAPTQLLSIDPLSNKSYR